MRAQTQRDVLDLSVYAMILCLFVHLSVFSVTKTNCVEIDEFGSSSFLA